MIRILVTVTMLLALVGCKEGELTATNQTSPGGVAFRLLSMPDHEDVTIHAAWPTDWAYRPETNKAAPFIGAQLILAGGAEGYPAGEVVERFADLNSEGNIYVGVHDHIIGELTFPNENIDETVKIANAHLRAPTLEKMWFDRIREGIAKNTAEAKAQPLHAGYDAIRWAVFGEQPLRNALSLDAPDTFESLTRDMIVNWHSEVFTRNPEAVVVAGNIDAEAAGKALDALLDGLPATTHTSVHEVRPDYQPRRILLHVPDAPTSVLSFIAPLPPTRNGGEIEDLILTHALGGNDQSVLFDAVRSQLRASYGFGAATANYSREHRILALEGEVDTGKLAEAERVVRAAYAAFLNEGPRGALDDRKATLEAHFSKMNEFVVVQARSELQAALDRFATGLSFDLVEEVGAVTPNSLSDRLATEYPAPDAFVVIAVSSDAGALPGACVITLPREAADCP